MKMFKSFKKPLAVTLSILTLLSATSLAVSAKSAPQKVSGLKQTSATQRSVGLSWKSVPKASKYEVNILNSKKKLVIMQTETKTKSKISGLAQGKTYYARVRAYTKSKKGAWSDKVKVITAVTSNLNIYQVKGTSNSATFEWTDLTEADMYKVYTFDGRKTYYLDGVTKKPKYTIKLSPSRFDYKYLYVLPIRKSGNFTAYVDNDKNLFGAPKILPTKAPNYVSTVWDATSYILSAKYKYGFVDGFQFEVTYAKNGKNKKKYYKQELNKTWAAQTTKATNENLKKNISSKLYFEMCCSVDKKLPKNSKKVRVRAYSSINCKLHYSPWSKSVKVKK